MRDEVNKSAFEAALYERLRPMHEACIAMKRHPEDWICGSSFDAGAEWARSWVIANDPVVREMVEFCRMLIEHHAHAVERRDRFYMKDYYDGMKEDGKQYDEDVFALAGFALFATKILAAYEAARKGEGA